MPIAEDSAGGSPVPVPTDLTTNLTGQATGSGTLDYTTGDIDIVVTVVDNGHNHILDNITDVQVNNAISGQVLKYNGNVWVNGTDENAGITAIVQDTTPQLGGNLDLNNRNITGTGNIAITGTIDGRDVSADGTKLDGIESGATADQTAAQIKTAYESNADTNAFTDADHTKLDGIETAADVTDTTNVVASLTAGTNVTIAADGTISATGGTSGIAHVVDDTTPQLGGNLDLNSNDITGTGNLNFTGSVTLSGTVDGRDVAADGTKLDGIEASADVTDTANVTAAGALMDSEVTNLAQVKAFDSSDYATAAQGTTADAALPKAGGTMTGDLLFNDGVKAKFGNGDLQIFHDGSNSYINEIGTGDLVLQTNGAKIGLASASPFEWLLEAVPNNAVTLYYDGASKLATTSTGIAVTGKIGVGDANTVADHELHIQSSSPTIRLEDTDGNKRFDITQSGNDTNFDFESNIIYKKADGTEVARIDTDGIDVTGNINSTKSGGSTLTLENSITSISANELIGGIDFKGNDTSEDGNEVLAFIRANALDTTPDSCIRFGTLQNNGGVDDVVTERMRLDNYGRLGIGTTAPSSLLHLASTAPYITFEDTDNNQDWQIQATAWFAIRDQTANAERMRVDSSGRVGIGTTSPTQKLEVAGKIQVTSTDPEIFLTDTTTGVDHSIDGNSGVGNLFIHVDKNNEGSDPKFIVNVGSTDELIVATETGYVGIGAPSPDNRLHIFDNNSDISMDSSASGQFHIDGNAYGFGIALDADAANIYTNSSSRDLVFGVNETEVARVKPAGLDVTGDIGLSSTQPTITLTDTDGPYSTAIAKNGSVLTVDGDSVRIRSDSGTEYMRVTSNGIDVTGAVSINASSAPTWDTDTHFWAESGFGVRYDGYQHRWDVGLTRTEAMRIDSSGDVSIAGGNLNVTGTTITTGTSGTTQWQAGSGANKLTIASYDNNIFYHKLSSGNSTQYQIGVEDNIPIHTITNNTVRTALLGNGNFGVGSTAPKARAQFSSGGYATPVLGSVPTNASMYVTPADTSYGLVVGMDNVAPRTWLQSQHTNGASVAYTLTLQEAGGNVGIGTANATAKLTVAGNVNISNALNVGGASAAGSGFIESTVVGSSRALQTVGSVNTTQTHVGFENLYGEIGRIDVSAFSVSYVTSSDYRLKTDIQPMQDSIARVKALKPVNFEWKEEGTRVDGFIAHEAQEVVPEAISGEKDAMRDQQYVESEATGDIYTPAVEATYETIQVELTPAVEAVYETVTVEISPAVDAVYETITVEISPAVEATYDDDGNELTPAVEAITEEQEQLVTPAIEAVTEEQEQLVTPAVDATYEEQQQELTPAIDEVIHSSDVVEPDELEEGQLWRETTEKVMATRQVPDYQGIDQSKIVPLLTSALQDAIAKIEALETRLEALES